MSKRSRKPTQPYRWRPVHDWRHVRQAAVALRAPAYVIALLDHFVELQALNPHWKEARIRLGYGRHSEKERTWDHRRREVVAARVGKCQLVQLPSRQCDGAAEKLGCSRRTAIRAMHWLTQKGLVITFHAHGKHPVRDRYGVEHEVGRGGCVKGGAGAATTWMPAVSGREHEPVELDPDPDPDAEQQTPHEPVELDPRTEQQTPRPPRPPLASFLRPDPRARGPDG